ncbi:MAG TPA: carbohydrate ABC transporter permease [Polyangiaceae bacterium]|nr:carbohydrate ABC transporter permease [Polyangiaceae bacterium]
MSANVLEPTNGRRALTYAVLLALSLPAIAPLLWMVSTSLKADSQIYGAAAQSGGLNLVPFPPAFGNYPRALESIPFVTYLENTVLLCVLTVIGAVGSSAVVAYGFARLRFRGRGPLLLLAIATMALPQHVTMIPVFTGFRAVGWYGTFLPLFVPSFFGVPFFIFLLTQFFRSLPEELAEAARIDGAGEWKIFWQVVLPLSKPPLITCALFQFLNTWNDFLGPLLYLNDPSRYTLAYGLQQFMASFYGGKWAELMAAATLFTLPAIALFFFAQRTFIQGIATTGSKN